MYKYMTEMKNDFFTDVPHAHDVVAQSKPNSLNLSNEDMVKQLETVKSHMMKLSAGNPTVSFNLDHPLNDDIVSSIIEKGYSYRSNSYYSCSHGGKSSYKHQVSISLPGDESHDLSYYPSPFPFSLGLFKKPFSYF